MLHLFSFLSFSFPSSFFLRGNDDKRDDGLMAALLTDPHPIFFIYINIHAVVRYTLIGVEERER